MDLFTYLMAKKGHNTHRDLFSYLLGKNAGGSGTYTTFSGTSLNISNTLKAKIKNFMLNSTELTQDGTPTPDTPQDIHAITGSNNVKISDGVEEQNYPIDLSSKNLFNDKLRQGVTAYNTGEYSNSATRITSTNWITLPSGTYTINAIANNNKSLKISLVTFDTNDTFYNIVGVSGNWLSLPCTFTTDVTLKLKLNVSYSDNSNITINEIKNVQVEEGSTATNYEPYYNLEYCKIGDYADQIFKNTTDSEFYDSTLELNEWYLKKNIGKIVLNGSENWSERTNSGGVKQFYSSSGSQPIINYKQFCNYFLKYNQSLFNWGKVGDFAILAQTREFYSCVSNDITLEDFKSKLANENLIVYYVLATPQYIHISQTDYPTLKTQLDNLYNNAKSYNGTTTITQTNDDLPFNISVDVKVANL